MSGAREHVTSARAPSRWLLAACLLLGVPATGITASFALARTEHFNEQFPAAWFDRSHLAYTAHDSACDVLIFGDSTAITGLDAELLQAETGLRSCNIAQTRGVLSVLQFEPLDRFLQSNPPPRYLVLQFEAANMRALEPWGAAYIEGVQPLLAYYPLARALGLMAQHPDSFFALPKYVAMRVARRVRHESSSAERGGSLPNTFFTVPLPPLQQCDPAELARLRTPSAAWFDGVRARYRDAAQHLLIEVAPAADCDPRFTQLEPALRGYIDNQYERFPIELFNDRMVHFTREGSRRLTQGLAKRIAASEHAQAQLTRGGT